MKVLLPGLMNEPELVDRFLREIRISASLEHPNIAQLRTAQRVGDQLIMIMEFVEGSTLDALMHAGRIPIPQAADYLRQALAALGYAHARGVVHRDIKPGNIFVTPTGVVKLMDFGIAKAAADQKLTKTGLMVGSVFYMSPEQIEGGDLDARSDLYSLGVTLYEIATGQRPFNGDSEYKIMAARLKDTPVPPRDLDLSLSPELNAIVLKALAKDPNRRFQTAEEFAGALERFVPKVQTPEAQTQGQPRVSVAPQPARQSNTRMRYMVAGSVVTIGVLAAAIIAIPKFQHASATSPSPQSAAPSAATPSVPEQPAQAP
jgi:eukaryotic-like serine/threonine-protein kinase